MWEDIETLLAMSCRGIVFQEEVSPTTGERHLQGFVRFDNGLKMAQIKQRMKRNDVHLEPSVAPSAAVEYCRKGETRDGECYEEGDLHFEQGKSLQVRNMIEEMRGGATLSYIVAEYPVECLRHSRGIQFIKFWNEREQRSHDRELRVCVLIGSPGTGKSRAAYEYDRGLYKVDRAAAGGEVWFDGYDGESTLLIDDFYGWIPYSQLLNLLDRYPLRLATKGGHTYAKWDTVIITSNAEPWQWYREACDFAALTRRVQFYVRSDDLGERPLRELLSSGYSTNLRVAHERATGTPSFRPPRTLGVRPGVSSPSSVPVRSMPIQQFITIEGVRHARQPNGTYAKVDSVIGDRDVQTCQRAPIIDLTAE